MEASPVYIVGWR